MTDGVTFHTLHIVPDCIQKNDSDRLKQHTRKAFIVTDNNAEESLVQID